MSSKRRGKGKGGKAPGPPASSTGGWKSAADILPKREQNKGIFVARGDSKGGEGKKVFATDSRAENATS